jgi:hypothetical protein
VTDNLDPPPSPNNRDVYYVGRYSMRLVDEQWEVRDRATSEIVHVATTKADAVKWAAERSLGKRVGHA